MSIHLPAADIPVVAAPPRPQSDFPRRGAEAVAAGGGAGGHRWPVDGPMSPARRDPAPSGAAAVATPGGPATVPALEEPAAPGTAQQTVDALLPVVHPAWCDRQRCTAKPTPTGAGYDTWPIEQRRVGQFGRHESAPVDVPGEPPLQVIQHVEVWKTSTFVRWPVRHEHADEVSTTVAGLARALSGAGLLPQIVEFAALYAQPPGGTEVDRHAALVAFAAQVMVATDTRRDEDPADTVAAIAAAVDRLSVVLGWTR